jgi:acyl-CoA oxidase
VHNFYHELLTEPSLPEPTKTVLWLLFRLFALHKINRSNRDFTQSGALSNQSIDRIADTAIGALMTEIRPHAVKLVDAWKLPDYLLYRYVAPMSAQRPAFADQIELQRSWKI